MRFLIVDDDPESRRLLRYHIEVEWPDAFVDEHQPSSAGASPESLEIEDADLVLLGHPLSGEHGLAWLGRLRARSGCPPVIVFADPSNELLAVEAMKAGAAGYFPKSAVRHQLFIEALRAGATGRTREADRRGAEPASLKHRFIRKLHATDVSTVYLAETQRGERVVCKVLRQPQESGGPLFERFLQEYEIIARLRHENVARIFDLGIADDQAYIVMEYLPGGTLAQRIALGVKVDDALVYLRQIGGALAAIHEAGVLHRDLKPANIMFRRDGSLALIDFGLAKQLRLEVAITGTGKIFGTPYYMSPEQGHAEPADERSDLYSLGCIAFELLTGAKPFTAASAMGLIYKHAHAPRPRLPSGLERFQPVLDGLLAVVPEERLRSAGEFLDAVAEI
ncbi:MAG TPA: protein kinase [Gammaproteobacteria bacterium]|nr:protein kinase [Gammaproteobacteria bacterium]